MPGRVHSVVVVPSLAGSHLVAAVRPTLGQIIRVPEAGRRVWHREWVVACSSAFCRGSRKPRASGAVTCGCVGGHYHQIVRVPMH